MAKANSPLRYPGGKAVLTEFLAETIRTNEMVDCVYVEPFAGGAGAAINLLLSGSVEQIILNDADRNIYCFWRSILDQTEAFLERMAAVPLTVSEWCIQRDIYENPKGRSILDRGFAAFYLNRCNRSGILTNGGVIGGLDQSGKWKIDARFNKVELAQRIERISAYRDQISLYNLDAVEFLRNSVFSKRERSRYFIYLDPPYFDKGSCLYLNYYEPKDHANLAAFLRRTSGVKWLVTYDNVQEIRDIYDWCNIVEFSLKYSAHSARDGSEILIHQDGLHIPIETGFLRGVG